MSPEDYTEYQAMRASGDSPDVVFLAAERQRDLFFGIRVVRAVFGFTLPEAKEVMIRSHGGAKTLDEYQASLLPAIKEALEYEDNDTYPSAAANAGGPFGFAENRPVVQPLSSRMGRCGPSP